MGSELSKTAVAYFKLKSEENDLGILDVLKIQNIRDQLITELLIKIGKQMDENLIILYDAETGIYSAAVSWVDEIAEQEDERWN